MFFEENPASQSTTFKPEESHHFHSGADRGHESLVNSGETADDAGRMPAFPGPPPEARQIFELFALNLLITGGKFPL